MKKIPLCLLLFAVLFTALPATAASWQLGLDWQFEEEVAPEALKLNCWFAPRLGLRSVYTWEAQDLGVAVLYIPQSKSGFHSYIGLGLRDALDKSGSPANQRLELTTGFELRLDRMVPGLSAAVEGRLVLASLVGAENRSAPFLGVAVHYGFTPVTLRTPKNVDADLYLLAKLIQAEAGGEPYEGKVAVGAVVMNRVKSPQFPNTIYDVIYQPGQFSCLPKLPTTEPDAQAIQAAREAMAGRDPSRGALYYYNPKLASREGARFFRTAGLTHTVTIGNHQFFK
ncbi:MAG TPA: cell wall hydrolase [Capillibacterium sp.]